MILEYSKDLGDQLSESIRLDNLAFGTEYPENVKAYTATDEHFTLVVLRVNTLWGKELKIVGVTKRHPKDTYRTKDGIAIAVRRAKRKLKLVWDDYHEQY